MFQEWEACSGPDILWGERGTSGIQTGDGGAGSVSAFTHTPSQTEIVDSTFQNFHLKTIPTPEEGLQTPGTRHRLCGGPMARARPRRSTGGGPAHSRHSVSSL